ncbi:MAG: c-type cytochrome [Methylobacteriaceae bacterium]|nr:c-type cytochrome [Methylobacteriaceae bacterium]
MFALAALGCGAAQAQDLAAAKKQFIASCGVCHAIEPGAPPRQGPNLLGVYGAKAANVEGFKYSPGLQQADWVWDGARLDAWLADPNAVIPDTVMIYRQADPARRALVIAFLKSIGKQD